MAFQVRFCRFLLQSVLKIYSDVVCDWVLVYMYVCLWTVFLCSVFCWGRIPQSLHLVFGLMLILVVGSVFWPVISLTILYCFYCLCCFYSLGHVLSHAFCIWTLWQIYFIPFWMSSSVSPPCMWSISFPCFFFMIFLWLFRSSSYQGFCAYWLLFLLWLVKFSWWFWAFHCSVGWLLYQVLCFPEWVYCWIYFWIVWLHHQWIFTRLSFPVLVLCFVSSVMNLWSDMYDPAMSDPWYVAGVMIRSNVCPRLCVGMLTCCFKLKAGIVCRSVCASWSLLSFIWMLMSPMLIKSWCLGSSSVSSDRNKYE